MHRFPLMVNDATHNDLLELGETLDAFGHSEVVRRAVRFYYYFLTNQATVNAVGLQENLELKKYDGPSFVRINLKLSDKTLELLKSIRAMTLISNNATVIRIAVIRYNHAIKEYQILV